MILTTMSSYDVITERRKFAMPRATFQVLTLNGVTTVAASPDGKTFFTVKFSLFGGSVVQNMQFLIPGTHQLKLISKFINHIQFGLIRLLKH